MTIIYLLVFYSFAVLGIKTRALCMLGKLSPTEFHPQLISALKSLMKCIFSFSSPDILA
jgi:hypothetical protein